VQIGVFRLREMVSNRKYPPGRESLRLIFEKSVADNVSGGPLAREAAISFAQRLVRRRCCGDGVLAEMTKPLLIRDQLKDCKQSSHDGAAIVAICKLMVIYSFRFFCFVQQVLIF